MEKENKTEQEIFKSYASQDEWQKDIDAIIGKRLGELRETKDELDRLRPLMGGLMEEFGAQNPEEILAKVKEREEKISLSAAEKADRVSEGALEGMNGFSIRRDPSRLTFEELDDIARRVKKGEIIEF